MADVKQVIEKIKLLTNFKITDEIVDEAIALAEAETPSALEESADPNDGAKEEDESSKKRTTRTFSRRR